MSIEKVLKGCPGQKASSIPPQRIHLGGGGLTLGTKSSLSAWNDVEVAHHSSTYLELSIVAPATS
ncbi:MAG: hypothetical protein JO271_02525 [Verrucomicrobia bacterium]|nr:hypothetical protein [Verrucomicrobiota bacterium]